MAEIKLFEGHVESIKELRKQLADLKDAYAALASEETKDTDKMAAQLNEVAKAQDLLNDVMGNTKNAVSEADRALAQSYNTMQIGDKTVNQLRADLKLLTAVLNDTKPGPGWDELNQKVKQVNEALKGIEQSHGDYRRSVGSYAKIFDNFEKGANQVKQAGNDIQGALNSLVGAMSLTKSQQDDLNDSLNQFRSAMQVINGAKGIAGLVKNIKDWTKSSKAKTAAQKADTAQMNLSAGATRNLSAAEKEAAATTSFFSTVLNTLPFVALATAIGILITHFEEVAEWFKKALQWLGLIKKQEDDVKGSTDKLTQAFEEQNEKLADEQKLAKARGVSNTTLLQQQKELYQQQLKDIQAKKADIEARIAQLKADSAWVRFWKRENKQIKEYEEELEQINNVIKELTKNVKDVDIDIQVEGITAARNKSKQVLDTQNAELKKAQERANSEIEKINDNRDRTEIEKVNDKYAKIRKILQEGYDAEIALASGNTKEKLAIDTKYTEAKIELAAQENYEVQSAYRKMLVEQETVSQKYAEFTDQMKTDVYAYRHLIENIFGDGKNTLPSESELNEIEHNLKKLQDAVKTTLENVKNLSQSDFEELAGMTNETILELYDEMLQDEDKFIKEYKQPFSEALGILARNIMEQGQLISDQTALNLRLLREQVEQELESGEWTDLRDSLYEIMGLKGNDPHLNYVIDEFVKNVKKEYVDAIMNQNDPSKMNRGFFEWLNEGLNESVSNAKISYDLAIENFKKIAEAEEEAADSSQKFQDGIYASFDTAKNKSQEYLDALAKVEEAEQALHEAREQRMISYAQVAEKYMDLYGSVAENMLTNVAKYWETTLKIKDDNLKKDLEQGKISQKEYEAAHKRNEDSFNQMKKLQIAAAVISTAAAIVQALADPTVPNFYLRLANSIAAGLAGAAEIATIRATELGSSGGGSGTSAPQLVDRSPMVQTVGMNPNDYAAAQSQQPIRAYVVDSDLKAGLETLNNRENETTF